MGLILQFFFQSKQQQQKIVGGTTQPLHPVTRAKREIREIVLRVAVQKEIDLIWFFIIDTRSFRSLSVQSSTEESSTEGRVELRRCNKYAQWKNDWKPW